MRRFFVCVLLVFLCASAFCATEEEGVEEKKKLLFLSAFSMQEEAVMRQIDGITSVLPDSHYEIAYEFMDYLRFNSSYDLSLFTVYLKSKLNRQSGFDCIIAGGDAALVFLLAHPEMRGSAPVVFFGVQNPEVWDSAYKYDFLTGIYDSPDFSANLKFASSIVPAAKHIAFVIDSSPEGIVDTQKITDAMEGNKVFSYEILNISDMMAHDFKEKIESFGAGTVIFITDIFISYTHSLNSLQKTAFDICSAAHVPVFCVKRDLTGSGVVGGVVSDDFGCAKLAADIAKHVIEGTDVSKVHPIVKQPMFSVADKKALDRFSISTFALPPEAVIANYNKGFFERYRIAILAGAVFVLFLAFECGFYFRRSVAQKRLLETDNKVFRHTAFETADYIAVVNIKDNIATLLYGSWFEQGSDVPDNQRKLPVDELIEILSERYVAPSSRDTFFGAFRMESILSKLHESKDGKIVFSGNFVSKDGETITKLFTYSFLDHKRGLVLSYRTDITQSVREEQEKNEKLRLAVASAQKANDAKTQFLSRISHDIRTPIGAILNLTEFAKKDVDNRKRLDSDLDKIATSGRFLLSLINDVLDVSKIDSDKITLNSEPYSFVDYIKEIKNIITPMCKEKRIAYRIVTQNDGVSRVMTDKIRLNQVTLNLLSNAVKYTAPGGTVTFRLSLMAKKDSAGNADEADMEICVADTGIGMSPSFQSVMFDAFSQEEDNPLRSKEIQGTGLGLAIVKRLVTLMGGTIGVRSELGKGSAITVRLAAKIAKEKGLAGDSQGDEQDSRAEKIEGRILLAEDNEINAAIACRIFEEIGVQVDLVANGEEEVKKFASSPEGTYLAIITDIQMPVMNGYEAAEKIRELSNVRADAKTVPIVAMTANAYSEVAEKASGSGMTDFTTKPLDSAKLRKILRGYAEQRRS